MSQNYQSFVIRVNESSGDHFPVQADFQGAMWTATIPCKLPLLTEQEIEQAKQWLERGFIDRDYTKEFGRRLFQTIFQGPVLVGFRTAYERAMKDEDGLRVVLVLPPPLRSLPWELMYDEDGGHGFLARSITAPLVRHYDVTALPHLPPRQGPLRVLLVMASPPGYSPISSRDEAEKIRLALLKRRTGFFQNLRLLPLHLRHTRSIPDFLERIRHRNLFEITTLPNATKSSLQKAIGEAQRNGKGYHVVHFTGHGLVDSGGSYLVFVSEENRAELVTADQFAEMLSEPSINLAVLNACQTASTMGFFASVAETTLQRGVPSVIGMQVPVLDRTALGFAEEFYGAWAAGQPIESALAYARRLTREETPSAAADWSIPVLFMKPVEGLKLNLTPPPLTIPPVIRVLRWIITVFLSLLGTIGLLLTIPEVNQRLRTEVPVIRCVFPYPMENGFNVVVSPFYVVNENGSAVISSDGTALADYLYQQLNFHLDDLDLGGPHAIRPPGQTCPIRGKSPLEREANAAALAEKINADVVVYGVIKEKAGTSQSSFSPEFYVNYKGFEEGGEITGEHELGDPLVIVHPFDPGTYSEAKNPALTARTKALSLLSIGLAYYSVDNFNEASSYFLQSRSVAGWSETAGKEVLYLLLGNASNRRASKEKNPGYLRDSLAFFDEALRIKKHYARAMVGKAGALYLLALDSLTENDFSTLDLARLDEADKLYQDAAQVKDAPATANIETKVNFGLGQVNFARSQYAEAVGEDAVTPLTKAKAEFQAVLNAYSGGNARVANLAGHSYARLGLIARLQQKPDEAIKLYTEAVKLVTPYYQSYYNTRLGEIYLEQCQIDLAEQCYERAIGIAEFYGYEAEIASYTKRLEEIKIHQCP